jgi:GPN-loop GTPase
MINLELPQINIISKIDLLKEFKKDTTNTDKDYQFPLSFFKNPDNSTILNEQLDLMNINPKFKKLNKMISEFVIDYGLVSFDVLDVKNQVKLNKIATLVDKANGYIYLYTGRLNEEKYIDIRNTLAKNEMEYDEDDYDSDS